jgi:hypothetical protein
MKANKNVEFYLILLFILITPASLIAQEKFLKLSNIISSDSSITFTPTFNNLYSNKVYYRVPAGKHWKIQSINTMGIMDNPNNPRIYPAGPLYLEINNKLINYTNTDGGYMGSIWCLPGDLIALYASGSPNFFSKLNFRMIAFEFLLEQ